MEEDEQEPVKPKDPASLLIVSVMGLGSAASKLATACTLMDADSKQTRVAHYATLIVNQVTRLLETHTPDEKLGDRLKCIAKASVLMGSEYAFQWDRTANSAIDTLLERRLRPKIEAIVERQKRPNPLQQSPLKPLDTRALIAHQEEEEEGASSSHPMSDAFNRQGPSWQPTWAPLKAPRTIAQRNFPPITRDVNAELQEAATHKASSDTLRPPVTLAMASHSSRAQAPLEPFVRLVPYSSAPSLIRTRQITPTPIRMDESA